MAAMRDLNEQVDAVTAAIVGKDIPEAAAIRDQAGTAKDRLGALDNEVQRPPQGMGYRDWPRLAEQLRFVAGGITGAQARPTDGQLEVLAEVERATEQRAAELTDIINTTIAELNRLLRDQPKIITGWRGGRIISMRR